MTSARILALDPVRKALNIEKPNLEATLKTQEKLQEQMNRLMQKNNAPEIKASEGNEKVKEK